MTSIYQQQLRQKQQFLTGLLVPFVPPILQVFASPAQHFRMRTEFRVWHQDGDLYHIMFDNKTKQRYRVDQLPVATVLINQLMVQIIPLLTADSQLLTRLYQIDYLTTTTQQTIISLIYHKALTETWQQRAEKLRDQLRALGFTVDIIGRAYKQVIYLDKNYVDEQLEVKGKFFSYRQIENSFTQPNATINQKMLAWASDCATIIQQQAKNTDLLELYCGNGNFTLPLSAYFRTVLATEISKNSVLAAMHNIQVNNITNIKIARLAAEELVQALNKVRAFKRLQLANIQLEDYNFSTIFVDPPRAGLDQTTLQLAHKFDYIIYISCNPTSLVRDLTSLSNTHNIIKVALFDQFPFTPHIETGIFLQKKVM